jgi:class 3 adenylate cyclase
MLREGRHHWETSIVALKDDIESNISTVFSRVWNSRDGQVVPKTDDVALANGAVKLQAVVLYADLADSTQLARVFPRSVAAKIVRAYLSSMTRIIKSRGGEVRSFDGDRVMGVFVGSAKNSSAAKCALNMKYVVTKILRPKAEAKFPSLVEKGFAIQHCAGVASSDVFVVRAGVRGSNDLVFIGSAPNIAAKLSDLRNPPWHSYVTWQVYNNLNDQSKLDAEGKDMWVSVKCTLGGVEWDCYKSSYWWAP